ncbi:hypothetical protein RS9917_01986 [Synechococcus sp. RS9917]|nr:hypothetical protein RS9917_01986 [Synechococcus sp. RS9917]
MGAIRRRIGFLGRQGGQACRNGTAAVAHLHLHLDRMLWLRDRDPVHGAHHRAGAGRIAAGSHHDSIQGAIQLDHVQGLTPGHPQALALADGEMFDPIMLAHHGAIPQHDLSLARRQVGVEKSPHRAVVIRQAEVLALRFLGGAEAVTCRFEAGVALGELPQRKHQPAERLLGQVVEEIALVFVAVAAAQ